MHPMKTLLHRELIENKISSIWLPLIIAAILVVMVIAGLIWGHGATFSIDGIELSAGDQLSLALDESQGMVRALMSALALPFFIPLSFVVIFYLAHALFDERKDRSILFWKSLPVSDRLTVGSKILTAVVVIPLVYWCALIITQVLILTAFSVAFATQGGGFELALINPVVIGGHALTALLALLTHGLWLLPLYGWVLFCSSWAPRSPLMVAIAVIAIISLIMNLWQALQSMNLTEFTPLYWVAERVNNSPLSLGFRLSFDPPHPPVGQAGSVTELVGYFSSLSMWLGVGLGMIWLAGAVWMRQRANA